MKKLYVLICLGLIGNLDAQVKDYEKFIPKPPEVSSIGKYLDKPISLGTGNVDYQISLETLLVDNSINIPINLKYNINGIKVNEEASNVGLGWALSTTSFITRNIRSQIDNYNIDLDVNINKIKAGLNSIPGSQAYHWLENSFETIDSEPDEFIVNIFNSNFRFYYNYQTKKFQSVPKNDYIINADIGSNGNVYSFNLIDTNGNKYYFNTITHIPSTTYITEQGSFAGANAVAINSWYLSKIITKNQNIVEFKYEINAWSNQPSNLYNNVYHTSQHMYVNSTNNFEGDLSGRYAISGSDESNGPRKIGSVYPISDDIVNSHKTNIVNNTYSASNNYDLIINKILVNHKKRIEFSKSSNVRSDQYSYSLEKIKVFDFNENLIKYFDLNQSYFNQEYSLPKPDCARTKVHPRFKNEFEKYQLRLRLDGITLNDNSGKKINDYHFIYYEGELPSRLSYSQDLYGYYNGKDNCSLIPIQNYNYYFNDARFILTTGNANRSSDLEFNKIGVLKKVIYPTKGSVELEYENHIVSAINDYNEQQWEPILVKKYINWGVEQSVDPNTGMLLPDTYTYEFEMTQNSKGEFYTYLDTNRADPLLAGPDMYTVNLEKLDDNGNSIFSQYLTNGNSGISIDLTIGKYRIQAVRSSNTHDYDPYLGYIGQLAYYDTENVINNESGYNETIIGGLRIKRIKNRDADNTILLEKKYTYTDKNVSSGILIGSPIRTENNYYKEINKLNGIISFPLQSAASSNVVYSKVTEENVDIKNNQTNKTEYYFKNELGEIGESNAIYRKSTPSFSWKMNQQIKVDQLLENSPLNSKINEHDIRNLEIKPDYGIRINPKDKILLLKLGNTLLHYTDFEYEYFPFYSEFPYLKNEFVIEYLSGGTVTTETNYNYGSANHLQLTSQTTKNSKGETITTEYQYPPDLVGQEDYMTELKEANRISEPVVVKQKVDGTYISEVHNQYNLFSGIIQKSAVHQKRGNGINIKTSIADRKITYDSYDTKGNLTQYTLENGIPVAIIWGYGGQYPVAKIEGTALSQISNATILALNTKTTDSELLTAIAALRIAHKDAMITGYLYKPLVGVTQIIQPNGMTEKYHYDTANRLKSIVNDQNEVIKTFEYNYKQP